MSTEEPIARLPSDEEEWCSICHDDNLVAAIQGGTTARGTNTILLCSKHAGQMLRELRALNLGLDG